ncbi:formylglycine-generating enzyme family protein [Tenebrionibacter intestinalis]|jgi:sulfatase modifying factor 1|uniref:SUMF1/EgtB/PvdO family nonheme iron enzyme n=3 Tax=Tenebrionibacter/Tenebrionicola group TaxID=2969848 RepID=A0A8K0V8B7_9ENTR|nr:SUMF1/EgtB/PvdO family nonheme iron enzyme [Tenebrionibacter intestinalis]MBK4716035.1 SUMF1/EgtB/PvdO family nonheme iron enzyme [Tenebrionibacter intestinalis]MBV5096775.1 SUMF1/EgtB/PvdO family nonheme iron enzyme [Tenebrionicola larvae]
MMHKYGILLAPLLLAACDNGTSVKVAPTTGKNTQHSAEREDLLRQIKANLVFVEGGDFLMGDFGAEHGPEKIQLDTEEDSKPLHKVTLSSYSISKFKTTNQEYQLYLKLNNSQLKKANNILTQELLDALNTLPDTPAHMDWYDAQKYCAWLGEVSGLPFALPTEAQWEYVARSRGKFIIVGTNSGVLEMKGASRGINISGSLDREDFAIKMGLKGGTLITMPVDSYPPNPLGIYDMAGNGYDWVNDWYDPDYYQNSPTDDPKGPQKPVHKDYEGNYTKVMRGADFSGAFKGLTVARYSSNPSTEVTGDKTVRCVVNSPQPVK